MFTAVVALPAAWGQPARSAPGPAAAATAMPDPVAGSIEGHPILLSEVGKAAQTLPESMRGMPFDTVYPVLLDRIIDHQALVMMARRYGLESRPDIQERIQAATDTILEGAWLAQDAEKNVTEAAIRDRYNKLYANRPATDEVRASHILVSTEAEARKVLDDLHAGADFATIARILSKDPDSAKGGDLGFFRRDQVWPGFGDVAFALTPGQLAPNPVKNEFGWHVVKVQERRMIAAPSYAEVHDKIRDELLAAAVQQSIDRARAQLLIHRFNLDGTEIVPVPNSISIVH